MSVLNASSSKTVSQVMQEHSYASPRAAQAVGHRTSSTSFSSPRSSRGLVGTHRSVTPPPSQGELEDIGNDLKRMLATPVESPRRDPLSIEPPSERPDLQLEFTTPAAEPEPEREPLQVRSTSSVAQQGLSNAASCRVSQLLDSDIVLEAEREYASKTGVTQQAHLAKLGLATDKKESVTPFLKPLYHHQSDQLQREDSQQEQVQQETKQQPLLLSMGQQQEVSLFMEQQQDVEGWKPWQLQDTMQQPDQQDQRAQEQQVQLRLGVTESLGDGQKFGLASTINRQWEQEKQLMSAQLGAHNSSPKAGTQQSRPYGQKLRAPAKALSLEDFRRERLTVDRQSKTTGGVSKRSSLADTLAQQRRKYTGEVFLVESTAG
jgi:hypothetical protein